MGLVLHEKGLFFPWDVSLPGTRAFALVERPVLITSWVLISGLSTQVGRMGKLRALKKVF